jgi:predicted aconitase with swiveling domain
MYRCWSFRRIEALKIILRGRRISKGRVEGEALVTKMPVSFWGGVNPETGVVVEKGHELEGTSISGKVLVFPHGKGSTVGSYVIYGLARHGIAPKAIINAETEPIVAVGAIMAGIPVIDKLDGDLMVIKTGDHVKVNADKGTIEVER